MMEDVQRLDERIALGERPCSAGLLAEAGAARPGCGGSGEGDQSGGQRQPAQAEPQRRVAGRPIPGAIHQQRPAGRADHHAGDHEADAQRHEAGSAIVGRGQRRRHGEIGNGEHRVASRVEQQRGNHQRRSRRNGQLAQVEEQREAQGQGESAQQQIGALRPPAVPGAVADGAHHRVRDRIVKAHGEQQAAGQGCANPQHGGHVEQREHRHGVERRAGCQGARGPSPRGSSLHLASNRLPQAERSFFLRPVARSLPGSQPLQPLSTEWPGEFKRSRT